MGGFDWTENAAAWLRVGVRSPTLRLAMDPVRTLPSGPETGYEHPNCYARVLRDCGTKISREHFISESVLLELGSKFRVTHEGMGWDEKLLPTNALASNVLCDRHNSALSPLDDVGLAFVRMLRRGVRHSAGVQRARGRGILNGIDVERWLLKTLCGFTALDKEAVPAQWVQMLYGRAPIERPAGLRMNIEVGDVNADPEMIEYGTAFDAGRRVGCSLTVQGWSFRLSLDGRRLVETGEIPRDDFYRLTAWNFENRETRRTYVLELMWPTNAR